jgi:hypothetical protein
MISTGLFTNNLLISLVFYLLLIVTILLIKKSNKKNQQPYITKTDEEENKNIYDNENTNRYDVEYVYYTSTYYQITHNSLKTINADKGKFGEYQIYLKLKEYENSGGKFLFNCYLNKEDGTTTEIDVILIHTSGIYVLESKNYNGWIFGSENQTYWTQTLRAGKTTIKDKFYNPIWQNKTHIKYIKKYTNQKYKIHSIIVFSDICTLKNLNYDFSKVSIIKLNYLYTTIKNIEEQNQNILSQNEVTDIYNKLYPYTQVSNEIKQKHINDINNMI